MSETNTTTPEPQSERTAIVFVHGQGQQRPMEDVQELARTVWAANPAFAKDGRPARTWTVPDARLGMADLGRVTTEAGKLNMRADFFELYWAHFMEGNRLAYFLDWFRMLQARPRREAPHGLLPVRQMTIRFFEAIALLSVLLTYVVAMLLPAPPAGDGLAADTLRAAFLGLRVPTTADVTFWVAAGATAVILTAWIIILINEIVGGAGARKQVHTLLGLKLKTLSSTPRTWIIISAAIFTLVLLVHLFIWQGPGLHWADMRLPLLLAVLFAGLALCARRIELAVIIALPAALIALVGSLFGGLNEAHLWNFGANLNLRVDLGAMRDDLLRHTAVGFYVIYAFAGIWAVFGVNAQIGAARYWWTRLFWTLVTVAIAIVVGWQTVNVLYADHPYYWAVYSAGVTLVVTMIVGFILSRVAANAFLTPVMTDSARYFSRQPEHVVARQKIREAGVGLLDRLHNPISGYNRVIIVAHSLGTAVAYELLMDYWSRQCGAYVMTPGDPVDAALSHVERAACDLNAAATADERRAALGAFQDAQRAFSAQLAAMTVSETTHGFEPGKKWLISDFITLGSPLTHASLLLADSKENLWEKQKERALAACPPIMFDEQSQVDLKCGTVTFHGWDGRKRPMHSAVFAAVRWTNHYFKTGDWIVQGDVIGGPLAPPMPRGRQAPKDQEICGAMGRGVRDVEVDRTGTGELFAHNEYWRSRLDTPSLLTELDKQPPKPQHIAALIEALDFPDRAARA